MNWFSKEKTNLNYIIFEVTPRCNLQCAYCYNHWKRPGESNPETDDTYNQNLKTLKLLFKKAKVKHVTFSGGEPTLAERLEELILFCRMQGASVSLISNGYALNTEHISNIIRAGVSVIEFPFHSNSPSVHDRMTGVVGSWEKAKHAIHTASQLGTTVVPVIVITKYNFNHLSETLTLLHQMGYDRIMLNRYNIGGRNAHTANQISANKTELNEAFKQASETATKLKMSVSSNVCTPHCVVDPTLYRNIAFTNCSSDLSKRPLTLTSKGNIRFCNHSPSVLGNINVDKLDSLLSENHYFNTEEIPAFCTQCGMYSKCLGGCRAAAEQVGRSFNDVDPIALMETSINKSQSA